TGGRNHTVPTTIDSSTSALRTRIMPSARGDAVGGQVGSPAGHRRLLDAAISPIALLIREDSLEKVLLAEVGPQGVGDPDFGVSNLPEKKVADAHLTA